MSTRNVRDLQLVKPQDCLLVQGDLVPVPGILHTLVVQHPEVPVYVVEDLQRKAVDTIVGKKESYGSLKYSSLSPKFDVDKYFSILLPGLRLDYCSLQEWDLPHTPRPPNFTAGRISYDSDYLEKDCFMIR